MLKQRREIAQSVADQLFAAEAAIDAALAETAKLTGMIPALRVQAGLSAFIGQEAIIEASQTTTALVKARSRICAMHTALTVAQKQMGLGAVAFGGLVTKPPMAEDAGRTLAVVPATAQAA